MICKSELTPEEQETIRKSTALSVIKIANETAHTTEEATVFVTAVLSVDQLYKEKRLLE